jgi:hypothetical protein
VIDLDPFGEQGPPPPTATPTTRTQAAFGEFVTVDTTTGPVEIAFTLDQARYVNVVARAIDPDINTGVILYNAQGRLIFFNDDYVSERVDLGNKDSVIDRLFLPQGTYSIRLETFDSAGQVSVGTEEATPPTLGLGQLTFIEGRIGPGEGFEQRLNLKGGELITLSVLTGNAEFDPNLQIFDPQGNLIAFNDDVQSEDYFLSVTDAQIQYLVIPADGEYIAEIYAFDETTFGTFQLIIAQYGILQPVENPVELYTGNILQRQVIAFPLNFTRGELITVTARALNSQIDPAIRLLDERDIILIENEDHNTEALDLGDFDARFTHQVIPNDGSYELELLSEAGRGGFTVEIQRLGIVRAGEVGLIDPTANQVLPIGAPTFAPESTAEPAP